MLFLDGLVGPIWYMGRQLMITELTPQYLLYYLKACFWSIYLEFYGV